jgi:serine/threonine protein kinase
MRVEPGGWLGPYEILSPLGAGGMGEVWRARDTRLDRTVAIKVLAGRHAEDRGMRERFEREARAISALSHPSICTLYGVGEQDGAHFLVMEYFRGESLADRLRGGPLGLEEALELGEAIAGALAAAHRRGIVHRDLKPGNVMLTRSGPKLLDFGLAKPHAASHGLVDMSFQETVSEPLTMHGTIVGTLQYMAPEQLEGRGADPRSDVFALGCVLYEMVTGRRAFEGETRAGVIGAVLHSQPPPMAALQPLAPASLGRVVGACLAKDPEERWQSAADVARELKWIAERLAPEPPAVSAGAARRRWLDRLAWAVAAVAMLVGAGSLVLSRRGRQPEELMRLSVLPPSGQDAVGLIELSPDGRRILLLLQDEGGRTSVWVRSLDDLQMRRLAGTDDARGMF